MSQKFSRLNRRLAAVEQGVAERVKHVELANSNAPKLKSPVGFRVAIFPEALEADMNEMCPVHGLCRFGKIIVTEFVSPDGTASEKTAEMEQLAPVPCVATLPVQQRN
jgi:hypothetical protein